MDHGETSRPLSPPPLNGSMGFNNRRLLEPIETYGRRRPSNASTPCWNKRPWRYDLNQIAFGNLGAVLPADNRPEDVMPR